MYVVFCHFIECFLHVADIDLDACISASLYLESFSLVILQSNWYSI